MLFQLSYLDADLAVLMAVIGAYEATKHHYAAPLARAHNGPSEMDIRQQCYEEARTRWPSTNQDMQTNRTSSRKPAWLTTASAIREGGRPTPGSVLRAVQAAVGEFLRKGGVC